MRMTQHIGLNDRASRIVEGGEKIATYVVTRGMFDEPIVGGIWKIKQYTEEWGVQSESEYVVAEYEQCAPWSSGPMIFTALRYVNTGDVVTGSLWTDEEINQY